MMKSTFICPNIMAVLVTTSLGLILYLTFCLHPPSTHILEACQARYYPHCCLNPYQLVRLIAFVKIVSVPLVLAPISINSHYHGNPSDHISRWHFVNNSLLTILKYGTKIHKHRLKTYMTPKIQWFLINHNHIELPINYNTTNIHSVSMQNAWYMYIRWKSHQH